MRRRARGALASFLGFGLLLAASGEAAADKIKHSIAVFSGLDKITGRIISFEVGMNETVQFGSLLVTDRVCYTRPPTEAPRTDTFVQVDEIDVDKTTKRIFSGWMFAASPGLNALDQPVYDIWLTDCKGTEQLIASPPTTAATPEPEEAGGVPATANPAVPPPAAKPAKPPRHSRREVQGTPPSASQNGPIEVAPPPGFQAPPDNGGDDQAPPNAGGDDQPPPDNGGNDQSPRRNGDDGDEPPPSPLPPGQMPPPDNNN
jgi:hypothetical protein